MVVCDAAGYEAGADVQALGSLPSVKWLPSSRQTAQLQIERLADGTIPIALDGRLTRNLDLLRGGGAARSCRRQLPIALCRADYESAASL